MKRILSLWIVVLLLVLTSGATATVTDTLRVGDQYAYYYGDSVFKVPVYYFNDNDSIMGLNFPFQFMCTRGPISPDSVTRSGRTLAGNIFDLFIGFSQSNGDNPDSVAVGFCTAFGLPLPPGEGIIANLWFSGAVPGDMMTFNFADMSDVGLAISSYPEDPDGGPIHRQTSLIVTEAGLQIACAPGYSVDAMELLTFPISVVCGEPLYTLEMVSLTGPQTVYPDPQLTGNDPWQFSWQPGYYCTGDYTLMLRATDAEDEMVEMDVIIHVEPSEIDPCDVLRGDLTCDGVVDITDLIYMVDWMFHSGNPPLCNPPE